MTPQEQAFLDAILEAPADDTPRLIFADWLDENAAIGEAPCPVCSAYPNHPDNPYRGSPGYRHRPECDPASGRREGGWTNCKECNCGGARYVRAGIVRQSNGFAERAELIRVQCELANNPDSGHEQHEGKFPSTCRLCHLEKRERELLHSSSFNIWRIFASWCPAAWTMTTHAREMKFRVGVHEGVQDIWCILSRGFTSEVHLSTDDWLEHGPQIVRKCPLEKVVPTDWRPLRWETYQGGWRWSWRRVGNTSRDASRLPLCIWHELTDYLLEDQTYGRRYATKEQADDALSRACIAWAKSVTKTAP